MKQVVFASMFGAAIAAALITAVAWPLALLAGASAGFFAYRFRQETLPVVVSICREYGGKALLLTVALSAIIAVVFVVGNAAIQVTATLVSQVDWEAVVYWGSLALLLISVTGSWAISGWIVYQLIEPIVNLRTPKGAKEWESPKLRIICMVLGLVAVFGFFSFLLTLLVVLVVVTIYCQERLLCAISAVAGGFAAMVSQQVHASPVVTIMVGALVGGLVGALQFRLISRPLIAWRARNGAMASV